MSLTRKAQLIPWNRNVDYNGLPHLTGLSLTTPAETFLRLARWTLPYRCETQYYGWALDRLGWTYADGVYFFQIGCTDDPQPLFLAHLDTVAVKPMRSPLILHRGGFVSTGGKTILGGDDRCGVSLILHLAHVAKIPGLYILTTGEECGRVGFCEFLTSIGQLPDNISCAISLDRKGTNEIITHQLGEQSCTDLFASILADVMGDAGCRYYPSPDGLFTDSLELLGKMQVVNLSVGYFQAHSKSEYVDLRHLNKLGKCLAKMPWNDLAAFAVSENEHLTDLTSDWYDPYVDCLDDKEPISEESHWYLDSSTWAIKQSLRKQTCGAGD